MQDSESTILYLGGNQGLITLQEVLKFSSDIEVVISNVEDEKNHKIYEYATRKNLRIHFRGKADYVKLATQKYRRLISSSFPYKIFREEFENVNGPSLNIHTAILPKYRGAHSGTWALINGEQVSGVTLHRINEKFDDGEILSIEKFHIDDSMWLEDINIELNKKFKITIEKIFKDSFEPVTIQSRQNIYWRKRNIGDSQINWHLSAQKLFYFTRALARDPIWAFTRYNSNTYRILRVNTTSYTIEETKLPGEIITIDGIPFVVCGDNRLLEIVAYEKSGLDFREGMVLH